MTISAVANTTAPLIVVLTSDGITARDLSFALGRQYPDSEVHVVRDPLQLTKHLRNLEPEAIVLDFANVQIDTAVATLRNDITAKIPTIVLDADDNETRINAFLGAGAISCVAKSADYLSAIRVAIMKATRLSGLQNRILETERHYRDILDASSDGIFVLIDGVFHYLNRTFAQAIGKNSNSIIEQSRLVDFVADNERRAVQEELARIEAGSGSRDVFDISIRSPLGKLLRFELACRFSVVEGKKAVVGVARDVTEIRALQEEIDRARQRSATLEKIRMVADVAAGVAHDLNNALEIVVGRATLAKDNLQKNRPIQDDLAVIENAAQTATQIITRMTTHLRPHHTVQWEDVDLAQVSRETAAFVQTKLTGTISLRLEVHSVPLIRGNRAELREVLLNLLNNALDAIGTTGDIHLRCFSEDGCAVILIEDNGEGMPPDVQQRIFEPFFTTKAEHGTGLGLSVSHDILRRHDAQIQLNSTPGIGTSFKLIFAPVAPTRTATRASLPDRLDILVVEDDRNVAEVIRDLLEEEGHNVHVVHQGAECVRFLTERKPDLLLSDLDLPGMSGWQLAREVRELQSDIVIGLITGWALGASDDELHSRGVDFVLSKPFTTTALQTVLNKITSAKKGSN